MNSAPVLPRRYDSEPAFDARGLFLAGLEHLRQLAGRTWTDHNLHDPGITLLELLTYALTELSYRASFAVPDLVAGPQAEQHFWRARDVLPCAALTANDYRRLLIDLPGVKNAWVEPHALTAYADLQRRELGLQNPGGPLVRAVQLQGLFDVRLEFMDTVTTAPERQATIALVRRTLAQHRNLGQEFVNVTAVPSTSVAVCAEVELVRDADTAAVAAAIMQAWADTLAPGVPNRSLAEMQALGLDGPALFEGPALRCGFITDADLQASTWRSEVRLSDIIAATMHVPGVGAVRDLVANALDADGNTLQRPEAWRVPLPAGTRARLAAGAGRLVLHKRGVPVLAFSFNAVPPRVADTLATLRQAARRKVETERPEDLPLPTGRPRDLAHYTSVQHDLPPLYGLADTPLPASASAQHQAQALQLGGYLLLFDQWMANLCAQLAHAPQALSVAPAHLQALQASFEREPLEARHEHRHQQAQRVRSLPQSVQDLLYVNPALTDAALGAALESRAEAAARWQANLDHLLARAGEDFGAYLDVMRSAFGSSNAQAIGDRCRYLQEAPALARERGLAADLGTAPGERWNSPQVSGLEKRIARLLGINNSTRLNLALVSYDTYAEIDADRSDEFRFRVRHAVSGKILLSASTHYTTPEAARAEMVRAIERAQQPSGYQRATSSDGRHYFNIVDATGEVIARRIEFFSSTAALEDAITGLASYLRDHYSGEGLYCIEALALRLVDKTDRATICTDPGCSDCSDDDPFSYRLHFVLPAYAGRFQDAGFRAFAEQTIREQTPAHLLPRVCWVGSDDMAAVEAAYRDWITLPEDSTEQRRREATAALREVLARAKNTYPARALFDCSSDEIGEKERPTFMLGRSALGTAPR